MNYQLTPISPVLIHPSAHLTLLTLLLIVTFNTCSYYVLFFVYSHGVALQALAPQLPMNRWSTHCFIL